MPILKNKVPESFLPSPDKKRKVNREIQALNFHVDNWDQHQKERADDIKNIGLNFNQDDPKKKHQELTDKINRIENERDQRKL